MPDDLMTPDDVCALLKVTKDWLYDQVQTRRIPHVRLGRHLRFRRAELLNYVEANAVGCVMAPETIGRPGPEPGS